MIFIGYQTIIPLFFSFYPKKLRKSPPPCPVPPCLQPCLPSPCLQPCLPPPCPRSRKFSSGLQLRAPSLVLPPFPPSLRFITRSPLLLTLFLSIRQPFHLCFLALPFLFFYPLIPIVLSSHSVCLQLCFTLFPLLSLTAIDVYAFDIPKTGNLTVTKECGNCTFVDNVLVSLVSPVLSFLPFPSPPAATPRGERGGISVSPLS